MKVVRTILMALLLFPAVVSLAQWKGKIIYSFAGDEIKQYDLAAKTDKVLFREAQQAFLAPSGEIFFIDQRFRKRNLLLRRSNSSFSQFRDVLDMTVDNPLYRERLENYSFIQKKGNSAVLSAMHSPKVSPNGKYLAVTITGYSDMVFDKDAVGVFDLATGRLIQQFQNKYYGSWTPDNRLVMAGAYLFSSSDDRPTTGPTPGIFISNPNFTELTRIDPELDDPSPYHPVVSPDGKKIAYVYNQHVWVMDLDGKGNRQLTAVDNDNRESFPTWSPDGKYIACWTYKTFERSYYTALAIVPANALKPVVLGDRAAVWPKDGKGYRLSGGSGQVNWKYDGYTAPKAPATEMIKPQGPAGPKVQAIKVGTKVSVAAQDGHTYKATVTEIREGKYKVKYDGYDSSEWLTRDQFTVL